MVSHTASNRAKPGGWSIIHPLASRTAPPSHGTRSHYFIFYFLLLMKMPILVGVSYKDRRVTES